jgi:hypothetical protein
MAFQRPMFLIRQRASLLIQLVVDVAAVTPVHEETLTEPAAVRCPGALKLDDGVAAVREARAFTLGYVIIALSGQVTTCIGPATALVVDADGSLIAEDVGKSAGHGVLADVAVVCAVRRMVSECC